MTRVWRRRRRQPKGVAVHNPATFYTRPAGVRCDEAAAVFPPAGVAGKACEALEAAAGGASPCLAPAPAAPLCMGGGAVAAAAKSRCSDDGAPAEPFAV